jgi:hypothetical protein
MTEAMLTTMWLMCGKQRTLLALLLHPQHQLEIHLIAKNYSSITPQYNDTLSVPENKDPMAEYGSVVASDRLSPTVTAESRMT